MNSGLVSLASLLMHMGDEKEREKKFAKQQAAFDKRQADREAWQQQQSDIRAERDRKIRNEDEVAKEKRKQDTADDRLRQGVAAMHYLASTNTPWNELKDNHQTGIVALYGGDVDKAAAGYEAQRQGLAAKRAAGESVELTRKGLEEQKKMLELNATMPTAARDAVAASNLAFKTAQGGGISPAAQADKPRRVLIRPDASVVESDNPGWKPDAIREREAMLKSMKQNDIIDKTSGAGIAATMGLPSRTDFEYDAAGNRVVVPANRYPTPPEETKPTKVDTSSKPKSTKFSPGMMQYEGYRSLSPYQAEIARQAVFADMYRKAAINKLAGNQLVQPVQEGAFGSEYIRKPVVTEPALTPEEEYYRKLFGTGQLQMP